jgi:hypothetical protein
MSHFVTIKTQIKDLAALRDACAELGLAVLDRAEARGFAGATHKGDHVLRLKGPFDIAVNQQPDGSFGLTCDWWDGHVEKEVGSQYGRLLQLYATHKATREARRKGLSVQRTLRTDGSIKLTIGGL